MRLRSVAAAVMLVLPATARAWDSPEPDVVLYCTHPLAHACALLASDARRHDGYPVQVFTVSPNGLRGLVAHRARADVVLGDTATVQDMAAAKLVRQDSVKSLASTPFVLARAHGSVAQLPDAPVITPDPTSAASFDGAAILHAAAITAKAEGAADTPDIAFDVRRDRSKLGLLTATEALGAGLDTARVLNAPSMQISGAVVTLRQSRNADAFLQFVASAEGQNTLVRAGLRSHT